MARHLGEHGGQKHHQILVRGFRLLRGLTPGYCLQALARLGYSRTVELAEDALKRGDLTDPALAIIVEALADLGTPQAQEVVREYVGRKVELLAEPGALRGVLLVVAADEIPGILSKFLQAVQGRGSHRAGEAFRTVMDALKIDDAAWCFRTGPSGQIELRKTIKAVESGYDCDIFSTIGDATLNKIAQRFRAGNVPDIVRELAEWTCAAVLSMPHDPEGDLPQRVASAVSAFASAETLQKAETMGRQFLQWVLGFQLSAAFAVARQRGNDMSLERAHGELAELLRLAEIETAFHVNRLPSAIALVCQADEGRARRAQEWCLRMLEAQGPFFPKVIALETLGELRAVHFVPEVMDYLHDENSYVYGAAERALSKMGEAIVAPAVDRIQSGSLDSEAAHSILVLLCDLGTRAGFEVVLQHLDWFMDAVGPGTTTEWVSLLGAEELIEPLRDWLEEDPAVVGQGVLLLGAIHSVDIPEEDEILRAIEDERARQAADQDDVDSPGGPGESGEYVM